MKFALRLTEIIYSVKGVFFIDSLNVRFVIKHVGCVFAVGP